VDNKKIKIFATSMASVIIISGLFVTADYFALFGTKTNLKLDFVEVRFRTLNKDTGALVFDVGVRCFQKNNMNACTRRESHQAGVVAAHIPVRRVIKSTLLFKKSEEIIKVADPKMHVMLVHQNYNNPTKTILLEDIYTKKQTEYTVEMPPRKWAEPETEDDE
jgi:hypothetical protein